VILCILQKTSIAGRSSDGRDKQNQDSFLIVNELGGDPEVSLFGVFDGHGRNGHLVSFFAKTVLPGIVVVVVVVVVYFAKTVLQGIVVVVVVVVVVYFAKTVLPDIVVVVVVVVYFAKTVLPGIVVVVVVYFAKTVLPGIYLFVHHFFILFNLQFFAKNVLSGKDCAVIIIIIIIII
jgi:hypothetical protein